MKKPRPTSRDVAKLAGVGQATVSRAFAQGGMVNEATRQRIFKAARHLNYIPNTAAAAVNSGSFGCVAMLTGTDVTHSLMPLLTFRAIDSALAERNMHLTFAQLPDDKLSDSAFVPKILKSWMADGLLINYNARIPERMRQLIDRNQLPSVWINSDHEHDCVRPDDLQAGRLATQTLLEMGHRRIMFIQPGQLRDGGDVVPRHYHYSVADRALGYQQAMREAGLTPQLETLYLEFHENSHLIRVAEILKNRGRDDSPTAIVVYNHELVSAFFFVGSQVGCDIPADMSLMTFTNEFRPGGGVPLDSVRLPDTQIGRAAVDLVLDKITRGVGPVEPKIIPVSYEPGFTCRRLT